MHNNKGTHRTLAVCLALIGFLILAEESFADPSKTRAQIWSGSRELIRFSKHPVPRAERVPENNVVVTFLGPPFF